MNFHEVKNFYARKFTAVNNFHKKAPHHRFLKES